MSQAEAVGGTSTAPVCDTHAVRRLQGRYCQFLDDGRFEDLAELFTP
jgi:hypothetical protein